ncbi:DUF1543 domain-containing protein [Inquilinus sp. KBS0705]|nr:DUF1543 domain-containing protein [Inquilinus sp. KBS0705]
MLLLGSRAPGRHVEQHDYFMGIAANLKDLLPQIKAFWRNTGSSLHIDGWREVNSVDGYRVKVILKDDNVDHNPQKLFFINLGGYLPNKLEEQHYVVLTVQTDRAKAIQQAKKNIFFRTNTITGMPGANAHVDDKYGIDVDDIYQINDMLPAGQKAVYHLQITPAPNLPDDELHLGYFRLDKL